MANKDTQDRINALVTEEKLQNNIADALKKNLDLRTKEGKIARDLALSSYLEAKRIKNTYMLEDLTDSDESDLEEK